MAGGFAKEMPLLGYSFANFGKNTVYFGAEISLLFLLTNHLGVQPAVAGWLAFLAIIADLVADLVVAAWIANRYWQKRSVMLAGATLSGACFALLYSLPHLQIRTTLVIALLVVLFRAFYAFVDVPHNAALSEISLDSRTRGRVAGYRYLWSTLAVLLIALFLKPVMAKGGTGEMMAAGVMGGGVLCGTSLIASRFMPGTVRGRARSKTPWRMAAMLLPPLCQPFPTIMGIAALTGFAFPMFVRTLLYRGAYLETLPDFSGSALLYLAEGQLVGTILWTTLIQRFEKAALLQAAYLITALSIVIFWMLEPQPLRAGITVLLGCGLSGAFMLPWAMFADLVDYDEYRCGIRREATIFTTMLVIIKVFAALGTATVGWLLAVIGYHPEVNPGGAMRLVINLLGCALPLVSAVVCIALVQRYKLTHAEHKRILTCLRR